MELYTLRNETLSVTLNATGAVLHSIVKDGVEYVWQGDPAYWTGRDYNLFPYVGRLTDGTYILDGKTYEMTTHGFVRKAPFTATVLSEKAVRFTFLDTPETYAMFPFHFAFHVDYVLEGDSVIKTCVVENRDDREMYFGLGGHPGFNVPLNSEGEFTDWQLVFPEPSSPARIELDPTNYRVSGREDPYTLVNGTTIPLEHHLFDGDAIVLKDMPRCVTICSPKSRRSVTVAFPDTPIVGFWHAVKTDAPYVCIEPWVSLPSHSAYVEDFAKQEYLIHLPVGEIYRNVMTVTVK